MKVHQVKLLVKVVLAILFLGCLAEWEYGYYQLVRFIGMTGFLILAGLDKKNIPLLIFWISSAILINPFFKIALGRSLWNIIDVIWALFLVVTLVLERRTKNSTVK